MDKEITKTLEIFNKSLEKLPDTASKTWDQLVQGFQIESIFNFVVGIIFFILAIILCKLVYKILVSKKTPFYVIDRYGDSELTLGGWFILVILVTGSIGFFIQGIGGLFSLPAIFAPEYFLIKTLFFP